VLSSKTPLISSRPMPTVAAPVKMEKLLSHRGVSIKKNTRENPFNIIDAVLALTLKFLSPPRGPHAFPLKKSCHVFDMHFPRSTNILMKNASCPNDPHWKLPYLSLDVTRKREPNVQWAWRTPFRSNGQDARRSHIGL
jgi:hypothetical protein